MESRELAGPWGPQSTGELPLTPQPLFLLAWCGERRGSCPGRNGNLEGFGTVPPSSPGMRGAWDGVGQRVEGRLPPRPQAVDEYAGHQRPLQLRVGCRRSPVHAAVHGRGRRRRRGAVHAAQQAWVVEIRRREHPLQSGVVSSLGQQLQAHCGLSLPLGSERKRVRERAGGGAAEDGPGPSPPLSALSCPPCSWMAGELKVHTFYPSLPHSLSEWPQIKISSSNRDFHLETLASGILQASFPGPLLYCPPHG